MRLRPVPLTAEWRYFTSGCKGQASAESTRPVPSWSRRRRSACCTLSASNPWRRSHPASRRTACGSVGSGALRSLRDTASWIICVSSTSSNAADTASRAVSPSTPIACTCRMTRARPCRRTTRSWRARARAARLSSSAPVDSKIRESLIDDAVREILCDAICRAVGREESSRRPRSEQGSGSGGGRRGIVDDFWLTPGHRRMVHRLPELKLGPTYVIAANDASLRRPKQYVGPSFSLGRRNLPPESRDLRRGRLTRRRLSRFAPSGRASRRRSSRSPEPSA